MKKIYTILFPLSLALTGPALESVAQNSPVRQGSIIVQMNELAQRGDSLYVDMSVTTEGRNVPSRMSADFTPVLVADGQSLALPGIEIKGRNNYKNFRRSQALMSQKERRAYASAAPYLVVPDYKGGRQIDYRIAIP